VADKFRFPGDLPLPGGGGEAPSPDSPLLVQLALSRAADLARGGNYEEAVRLLADLRLSSRQAVPVFDLCARIRAQIGMYEEAADLWKRVLQVDAAHEGARAGLREIQRLRARPLWLAAVLSWPVALAIAAGVLVLVVALPRGPSLEPLLAEQRRMARDLEQLRGAPGRTDAAPDFDPGEPAVSTEILGGERLVRFKAPLFDAGSADLKAEARELLGRLAAKLAGKADVLVVGYAVEPVSEADVLARKRAGAVADALRSAPSLRPSTADRPGGEAPEPRQAVVLRLSPVKK